MVLSGISLSGPAKIVRLGADSDASIAPLLAADPAERHLSTEGPQRSRLSRIGRAGARPSRLGWAVAGMVVIGVAVWWLWPSRAPSSEEDFESLFAVPSDYGRWEEVPQ